MGSSNKWKSLIILCTRQPSLIFVKFKKEKEEKSHLIDVIGGWGGENERALRKVAQRGGEFNFLLK